MKTLTCANCGAPLEAPDNADEIDCGYCQTKLVIRFRDPEPINAELVKQEEPPKKREAYTEIASAMRSGAQIASSAVEVVDKVSTVWFWTKVVFFGGILLLVFGCCGIPCYFLYSLLSNNAGVQNSIATTSENVSEMVDGERSETRATREAIKDLVSKIESEVRDNGLKLEPEAGDALANKSTDGWGRPLRYRNEAGDDFAILSSGPDGEFETSDDILEVRSIGPMIEYVDVPPPRDLEQTLAYFKSKGQSRVKAALIWLASESPESYDETVREQLVSQLLASLGNYRHNEFIMPALVAWCKSSDGDRLGLRLSVSNDTEEAKAVSGTLVKLGLGEQLVRSINHRHPIIRQQVSRDLSILGVSSRMIVEQCFLDMKDNQKSHDAVETLSRQTIAPEDIDWVVEQLMPRMANYRAASRREQMLMFIEKLGEAGYPLLIEGLESVILGSQAKLIEIGEPVEDLAIAGLEPIQNRKQRRLIELLGEIGTAKSVEPLEKIALENPRLERDSKNALMRIRSRLDAPDAT